MKKYFIFSVYICLLFLISALLIRNISSLELTITKKQNILNEIQKEIEKNIVIYDEKADTEKIANEMREKYDMEISDSVKFFKISKEK